MSTIQEDCQLRKKITGYKWEDKSVLDYDSVKRSIELIKQIQLPEKEFITTRAINPKRIPKIARKDVESLFPNLNRGVLFVSKKDIETIGIHSSKNSLPEKDLITAINKKATTVDLFSIPMNYTMQEERDGSALLCVIPPRDQSLIPQIKNITAQIDVAGPADYLTAIIYAHEAMHLLPRRFKGIIEDYYHEELLPIFIEKVIALEADATEDLIHKVEEFRLRGHQKDIAVIERKRDFPYELGHQHLISGLLANCMFDRYYNETPTGRRQMLDQVQQVLNGNKSVAELLQDQAITLSTSEVATATEHSIQKCLIKK